MPSKTTSKYKSLLVPLIIGFSIWMIPRPEALEPEAWKLFAIFTATIIGVILKPLPMGAVAMISVAVVSLTNTLTVPQVLNGFSRGLVWLVVIAFFIARGFIKTQLGTRIAFYFVRTFGKKTLGLSYSLIFSELLLAPALPSATARSGGIMYPIVNSLSRAFGSHPNDPSAKKLGTFLILAGFQASAILSAMFLTGMAGNPLVASLALNQGIDLSWNVWALAGIVPGLTSLLIIPFVIYKILPPEIKETPEAQSFADEKLKEMGKVKSSECTMGIVFIGLLILWVFGGHFGISDVTTALIGLSALLVTGTLSWSEVLEDKEAWNTMVWFGILLTLAGYLNDFGIISYFSSQMTHLVSGFSWPWALALLSLLYFYTHYFFASNSAHISAMYGVFLSVAILIGTPPMLAALLLAFYSNLFGGLTHYGYSPAPILYGSRFATLKEWWKVGAIVSIFNIAIWSGVGAVWWKFLGFW